MSSPYPGAGLTFLLAGDCGSCSVSVFHFDGPLQRAAHSMAAAFPRVPDPKDGEKERGYPKQGQQP